MKQIKMIVIDDEPIILRGLVETYPWHEMGFTIVGTATRGETGLALIKEKKPQVVLTDIKMNHMTGLTLINKVQEFDKNVIFIVMSAYKEFEYAKKACDIGVFGYLLKPIEEEVLIQTMQSVYKYCEKKALIESEYDYLKEVLLQNKGSFQNAIIERYLKDEISEASFIKTLEIMGKDDEIGNGFIGVCIGFDIACCILNQEAFEAQGFAVFRHIEKKVLMRYKGWYFKNGPDKMILILAVDQMRDTNEVKEFINQLINEAKKMTDMTILSVISSVFYGIQGLKLAYIQIGEMYNLACESGVHMLIGNNDVAVESTEKIYSENEQLLIISNIRKGDEQGLKEAYVHFLFDIENSYKSDYIKKCLHRMALSVEFFLCDSYGLIEEIQVSFDKFYALLPSLSKEKAQDVLYELLKKALEIKNQYTAEKSKKYFSEYISKALEYIEQNLVDEKLSITSVSEHVYLNSVYFGRLFKSTLNISFKQYVLNKRIELAKKKIMEEGSSMVTIGNEVGIPNSSYFTQVFKKTTGYLPSEYKREMMNEAN